MRYIEINSKTFALTELSKYLKKNCFISFTDLPKIGINPINEYNTPTAIYTYPLDYIYNELLNRTGLFATDRKYIQVVKPKTSKILDSTKYTAAKLKKDLKKIQTVFEENYDTIKENWKVHVDKNYIPSFNDFVQLGKEEAVKRCKDKNFAYLWSFTFWLSLLIKGRDSQMYWNTLLRKLGYELIIDRNNGVIYHDEPTQAVFLNKSALEHIETINNNCTNTIKINDKVYSLNNLPKEIECEDLDLSRRELTFKNVESIRVEDTLNLSASKIKKLPDYISANTLNLSHASVTELPDNLDVNTLDISNTNIKFLPENLHCHDLDARYSLLEEIPESIRITGSMDISHTNVTELPNDLELEDFLDLRGTDIKKLPEGLKVGGTLYLNDYIDIDTVNEMIDNDIIDCYNIED